MVPDEPRIDYCAMCVAEENNSIDKQVARW